MQADLGAQRSIDFFDDDRRLVGVITVGGIGDSRELCEDRIARQEDAGFEGFEIETLLRPGVVVDYRIVVVLDTIRIRRSRSRSHW